MHTFIEKHTHTLSHFPGEWLTLAAEPPHGSLTFIGRQRQTTSTDTRALIKTGTFPPFPLVSFTIQRLHSRGSLPFLFYLRSFVLLILAFVFLIYLSIQYRYDARTYVCYLTESTKLLSDLSLGSAIHFKVGLNSPIWANKHVSRRVAFKCCKMMHNYTPSIRIYNKDDDNGDVKLIGLSKEHAKCIHMSFVISFKLAVSYKNECCIPLSCGCLCVKTKKHQKFDALVILANYFQAL